MKKIILILFAAWFGTTSAFAQDAPAEKPAGNINRSILGYFFFKEGKPVRNPFEGGMVIDNQTSVIPSAKTLEMVIQHRFGSMENGLSDFLGIYGSANTRLGLNFTATDWLQIGIGTTKNYKLQDLSLKMNILKQTKDNKSPVDVTYYGNFSVDARDESYFGEQYKFGNRIAYFNELMVTRQFCSWFSMAVGGSFTHFNQVDSLYDHDKIALHVVGRIKFSPQSSVIVNCDMPLKIDGIKEWLEIKDQPKYNFGIGYEVATATHVFQVFVSSANYMVPQYNVMKNQYEFFKGTKNIFIGFNITRQWNF
jgi:hypothetical protein